MKAISNTSPLIFLEALHRARVEGVPVALIPQGARLEPPIAVGQVEVQNHQLRAFQHDATVVLVDQRSVTQRDDRRGLLVAVLWGFRHRRAPLPPRQNAT